MGGGAARVGHLAGQARGGKEPRLAGFWGSWSPGWLLGLMVATWVLLPWHAGGVQPDKAARPAAGGFAGGKAAVLPPVAHYGCGEWGKGRPWVRIDYYGGI